VLIGDYVLRDIRGGMTTPVGATGVRCGLPVNRPEPRNLESLVSALFGE
jgi:hypothetical protein